MNELEAITTNFASALREGNRQVALSYLEKIRDMSDLTPIQINVLEILTQTIINLYEIRMNFREELDSLDNQNKSEGGI